MTHLPVDTHHGRSFSPIAEGRRVLVVTSPALVRALLLNEYEDRPSIVESINSMMIGTMDAVQANPELGVLEGTVIATHPEPTKIGLHLLKIDIGLGSSPFIADVTHEIKRFIDTEAAITEALGGPLQAHAAMPAVPAGLDGDGLAAMFAAGLGYDAKKFEAEHPWFKRIGLNGDERSAILYSMGDHAIMEALKSKFESEDAVNAYLEENSELKAKISAAEGDEDKQLEIMMDDLRENLLFRPSPTFSLVFPDDEGHRRMLQEAFRGVIREMAGKRRELERRYASYL